MGSPHDPFEAERLRAEVHARLFGGASSPTIGKWQVVARIGKGAMGTVYRARADDGHEVAIKVVPGASTSGQARLRREAKALRELAHRNIVEIVDVGEFEHGSWVAMELVAGDTVRQMMATPASWTTWIERLCPIGDALGAVHRAGLVHRDVKPDNIVVGADGVAKLVDFGLAKAEPGTAAALVSQLGDPLTRTGASVGTPGYASPEQMLGKDVDGRTDMFGLAVTMWEAIFGVLPFRGATADAIGLAAIGGRIATPPAGVAPLELVHALRRALAADPAARYTDVDAFVGVLRQTLP
jgi:serine/threonine protein kinase